MGRTNIVIDDELLARVMHKYRLSTKREAVDLALRRAAGEPLTREEILELEGAGWEGEVPEVREDRVMW